MIKFISAVLLMMLLSAVACLYFPWWSIAVTTFIVAVLIPQTPGRSFLAGVLALFLLWGLLSWFLSAGNEHLLARKISLLIFQVESSFILIVLTATIGALVGGFGALTGSYVRPAKPAEETSKVEEPTSATNSSSAVVQ